MRIKKDHIYLFIVVLFATIASLAIWNTSQSIVYNTIIIMGGDKDGKKTPPPIKIISPNPLSEVKGSVKVEGEAVGMWFFEASFPVKVTDQEGKVLGQGPATATSDWMTEEFVPFEGVIKFDPGEATNGFVVFEPSDASGEGNYKDIKIPLIFAKKVASPPNPPTTCKVTGCSGQICSDEDIASTCEYRPEYACYKQAKCERQLNGECGWTSNSEFDSCIQNAAVDSDPSYPI